MARAHGILTPTVETLSRVITQPSISRVAIIVAALASALVASSSAAAKPPCAEAVIADWLDNSRIDRIYALDCYEAAIDAIPDDLRDYTDAADVIARAFQDRSGRRLERRLEGPVPATAGDVPPVDASSSSSVPVPILVLGGMSVMLLGAGGLGYLSRRRREGRAEE
jgi:hypothetical protein